MYLYVLFVNVSVTVPFHDTSIEVKLDDDLGVVVVPHEETFLIGREKVRVNVRS